MPLLRSFIPVGALQPPAHAGGYKDFAPTELKLDVPGRLSTADLDHAFDPAQATKHVDRIFERVGLV
jgi:hypothetical protein